MFNLTFVFIFGVLYVAIQCMTGFIAAYQLVLSAFGFRHHQRTITHHPKKSFAVFIPAHNEARVIGPLIESLKAQHYPTQLIDIFLIADNCTDNTAEVGRAHGAHVFVREDEKHRGKGYAIEWMLQQLETSHRRYDAIAMFDADNLVDKNFFQVMNESLCRGNRVIQGYLDIKNPFDSWVTVSLSISYWFDNRMWQKARANVGLPCALGGTGLCIDYGVLQLMGWKVTGLTEDLEFGVRCVAHGINPVWEHDAKVYDEKPTTFLASFRQRLRWQQGHFQCAKDHLWTMLKQGLRERSLSKIDTAIYLLQPLRGLLLFFASLYVFVFEEIPILPFSEANIPHLIPASVWITMNVLLYLQMPLTMILERVNWRAYFGLAVLPFFLWTWGPVTLHAYFTKSNRTWYHTEHNRSLRLEQLRGRITD